MAIFYARWYSNRPGDPWEDVTDYVRSLEAEHESAAELIASYTKHRKDVKAVIVPLIEYIQGGYNCSPAEQWNKVADALNRYAVLYCWDDVVEAGR